jgi:hypothetical protein
VPDCVPPSSWHWCCILVTAPVLQGLVQWLKNLQYLQTTTESVKSKHRNIFSKCKGHENHTTVHVLNKGLNKYNIQKKLWCYTMKYTATRSTCRHNNNAAMRTRKAATYNLLLHCSCSQHCAPCVVGKKCAYIHSERHGKSKWCTQWEAKGLQVNEVVPDGKSKLGLKFHYYYRLGCHCKDGFSGLVVRMLASGSRVLAFKPGRSRWIFFCVKNPQHVKEPSNCGKLWIVSKIPSIKSSLLR